MEGENFNGKGGIGKRRVERIPGVRAGPLITKRTGEGRSGWREGGGRGERKMETKTRRGAAIFHFPQTAGRDMTKRITCIRRNGFFCCGTAKKTG